MICVIPSTKLAGVVGDVPFCGVWIMVLVLGWLFLSRFWNSGLPVCMPVCCVVVVVVPIGVVVSLLDGNLL